MDEQIIVPQQDRSAWAARFHARLSRYRSQIAQRWWIPVLFVILAMFVKLGLTYVLPPSYVSEGQMIVSVKLKIPEGSVYTEELGNFLGTQAALMRGDIVVKRAHQRVLAKFPDRSLQDVDLQVSIVPKTAIFVLKATGKDPEYVREFLQSCMDEYIALKREMREQTSDVTLAGLTDQVLQLERTLRESDQGLAQFQSSNSVVLLEEQGNSAGMYLASLNQRLGALKSEYDLLQTLTLDQNLERAQFSKGLLPPGDDLMSRANSSARANLDRDYQEARQQILLLKVQQEELSKYLRPKHPKMIAMSEEITSRQKLLDLYREQTKEQLESKKESLRLQIENLEKEVAEWDAKNLEISRKTAEYDRLKANQTRIQALYDRLLGTMQTLDVNKEISPESVTVMQDATEAEPAQAPLLVGMAIAAFLGLAASFGLLMLLDRLDDRMNSFTELEELFEEPVIGQVPREKPSGKNNGDLALLQAEDERHAFMEAYRNIRSSLMFSNEAEQHPRTILVTSSIPNDGKSLTITNLAVVLALSGSKVLLVDADLRKGLLHERFGLKSRPGVSEVLQNNQPWRDALQSTHIDNLLLLPRGANTQRTGDLFLREQARSFLSEARNEFDYVLVDTAPVMAADDVTTLAPSVDGTIFVIRAEHTSARVARAALDLLDHRRANILGLVFNAVRASSRDYYYYHRYKDYYQSYPSK